MPAPESIFSGGYRVAIDCGSVATKAVALDSEGNVVLRMHHRLAGNPRTGMLQVLREIEEALPPGSASVEALIGSGAGPWSERLGLTTRGEVTAILAGTKRIVPGAGAILEIGGEHAKFIRLHQGVGEISEMLADVVENTDCMAGIGLFIDREANRLGIPIGQLGDLALQSRSSLRVAGRCAVFARTDLTHQAQNGASLADLSRALCRMTASNIVSGLIGKKKYGRPVVFVGGVAAFAGIRTALQELLRLDDTSLVVPADVLYHGAMGALMIPRGNRPVRRVPLRKAIELISLPDSDPVVRPRTLPRLSVPARGDSGMRQTESVPAGASPDGAIIGIDIGSTTTNVACLDRSGRVVDVCTVPTSGQAAAAVAAGLRTISGRWGIFSPSAVGVTGSGRHYIGSLIGADCIVNEINAHAAGGQHFFPGADTIFDIGGQDSKFIRMEGGSVVDFRMNKVCAAGTGSFLEEVSGLLGVDVKRGFSEEAFSAANPVLMDERCTVFMVSEVMKKLNEGYTRADLIASVCYAVVKNYLARVVPRARIGAMISFQGGVAGNSAIVSVMEQLLEKTVLIHPLHDVAGAVGAALIASRQIPARSSFCGLDRIDPANLVTRSFTCRQCPNDCEVQATVNRDGRKFFSGAICDLFDRREWNRGNGTGAPVEDLFETRERELHGHVKPQTPEGGNSDVIGIPRVLLFHELLPFWSVFFNELGITYVVSGETTRDTIEHGTALCPSSPCLPLKIAYGHCASLIEGGVTSIFVPSVASLGFRTVPERLSHACPSVQAWPFIARTLFPKNITFLSPRLRFSSPELLSGDIMRFGRSLGRGRKQVLHALDRALQAQRQFHEGMLSAGRRLEGEIRNGEIHVVLLGRPYLLGDAQFRMRLKKVLQPLGVRIIPWDVFDAPEMSSEQLGGMYWYYGKRFLQLGAVLRECPSTAIIFLSTFGCGSDSFLVHFLRNEFSGTPFLELEIDEHNEWSGVQTRVEAFIESIDRTNGIRGEAPAVRGKCTLENLRDRRLMIPRMSDHAFAFAAAFRSAGIDAEVLPLPDGESIDMGKEAVAGQECFPCVAVTGDMLRALHDRDASPDRTAFFMISGDGPCRLGQYPYLQRQILDGRGFGGVPIFDASQDTEFYSRLEAIAPDFKRKVWQGIVAVDLLYRKWRESRPYAADRSSFDMVYREELGKVTACLELNHSLPARLRRSFRRLEKGHGIRSGHRPVIAVLGENYMRCNVTANAGIEDALEELGAEVWLPSLYEWVYYTNWTARLHCRYEKRYGEFVRLGLVDLMQHLYEHRLLFAVNGGLRSPRSPSVYNLFRMASGYVPRTLEGETLLSIGRTIDYHRRGVAGIVHVVPFGCMVGSIVHALCERVSEDLGGFPVVTLHTDNRGEHLSRPVLESFWLRATAWHDRRPR